MPGADEIKRAWLSQAVGRELVRRVAPVLSSAGIAVVPLKGVWLQACVYRPPATRRVTDVDLLVSEDRYARALALLENAGWRKRPGNTSETALDHPEFELPLDLHRRLFTRGVFRLPTRAVFERARRDHDVFGVEVRLPDPMDAFAHLIGHFVKSRTRLDDPMRLGDFVAVADRFELDPGACARRVQEAGMARAAPYALSQLVDPKHGSFFRALLQALPRDPVGERAVALARLLVQYDAPGSPLGALPGFLLDRSFAAGAIALALRLLDRRREATD